MSRSRCSSSEADNCGTGCGTTGTGRAARRRRDGWRSGSASELAIGSGGGRRRVTRDAPPVRISVSRREVRERRHERHVVPRHVLAREAGGDVVLVEERAEDGGEPLVDHVLVEATSAIAVRERPRQPPGGAR